MKTEHMCSIAFKDRHTQEVKVAAGSSVAVPYTIVPLAVGKLPVEVMVVGRGLTGEDRIQKLLRVVVSSRTESDLRKEQSLTGNLIIQTLQFNRTSYLHDL